jgi:hypothetical protein
MRVLEHEGVLWDDYLDARTNPKLTHGAEHTILRIIRLLRD